MLFRNDINGLRAIAVLAVVIFHFNPHWLPGGFAGVDVFFVISGFLMTSIIFTGIEKNSFHLFKFYTARANRIIPVLTAMVSALFIFGWFYLAPDDYRHLAKQVEQSSIFSSNILFAKDGGYFDSNEKTKWLLHTWSLSVEWQFYIFFPILIVLIKKYLTFCDIRKFFLGLFLLSFCYCLYATHQDQNKAYFLLSSRAWEMLFGGLAFLFPVQLNSKSRIYAQMLGLGLIICSYIFISEETPWPGYMALLPVFGAYLIVLANVQNNILINNFLFRSLGKWSYSIYVWHWPLVVFGLYFSIEHWWLYGIPLSILIGYLSYQTIERIKLPTYNHWKNIYKVKPIYLAIFLLGFSYVVKATNGMEFHYPPEIRQVLADAENENPYDCVSKSDDDLSECMIGNASNIRAIVVGDSHANAVTTGISNALDLEKQGTITLSNSGCPYILNAEFNDNQCELINQKKQQYLAQHQGTPIILINRYLQRLEGENDPARVKTKNVLTINFSDHSTNKAEIYAAFAKNYEKTICDLTRHSKVYIVDSIPEVGFNVPQTMNQSIFRSGKTEHRTLPFKQYLARSEKLAQIQQNVAQKCGAEIIHSTAVLCTSDHCITQYQGRAIYRDGDHLNEYGNKLLTPLFKDIF